MNIAITGNTGFIGSALVSHLSKNKMHNLSLFDRKRFSLSNSYSLKEFVKNKDIIIHLAGIYETTDIEKFYHINTSGTFHLLQALALYGNSSTQFIFPSSFAVYGEGPHLLKEEKTKTLPRNHYGMSKLLAEEFIRFYHQRYNFPVRILRIANSYGKSKRKRYSGFISKSFLNIKNNHPIIINGDGRQNRDFIFIDDVVRAIEKCIHYQKPYLVVNICTGKTTHINDVIKKIEYLIGKKAILKYNTSLEKGNWIGDPEKAMKELSFKATITIDEGLRKIIQNKE